METVQTKGVRSFTITVPPIACSFAWKNHPDALKLKYVSDAWIVERCKTLPAACKGHRASFFFSPTFLVDSAMHLLGTLYFANAVLARLMLPIVKLMGWYFILDNFMDDPSEMGADSVRAEHLVDSVVVVFEQSTAEGEDACKAPATSCAAMSVDEQLAHHLIVVSAREWWEEMKLNMSPSHQARFSTLFIDYLNSNRSQVPFRACLEMPDLNTYFRIRAQSIGWYPLAVLIEVSLGIELDQEALTHPLLIKLLENVNEQIILVNDISSFGKEYTQGDMFNIVFLVCCSELGLRKLPAQNWQALLRQEVLQEGVRKVSNMIKERDRDCVRIMEEIRGSPVLINKVGMEAFLEALGYNVAGNKYFHLVSKRYGLCVPTLVDGHPDFHAPFQVHVVCP